MDCTEIHGHLKAFFFLCSCTLEIHFTNTLCETGCSGDSLQYSANPYTKASNVLWLSLGFFS